MKVGKAFITFPTFHLSGVATLLSLQHELLFSVTFIFE